jgi:hypothetical protein
MHLIPIRQPLIQPCGATIDNQQGILNIQMDVLLGQQACQSAPIRQIGFQPVQFTVGCLLLKRGMQYY